VDDVTVSKELLEAAGELKKLVKMDLYWADLTGVEPALLAGLVNRLEEVELPCSPGLTKEQLEAILQGIQPGTSRLRMLSLGYPTDLPDVEPALLAGAFNQLEEVRLDSLSRLQLEAILQGI
jgi:hypothetical protein